MACNSRTVTVRKVKAIRSLANCDTIFLCVLTYEQEKKSPCFNSPSNIFLSYKKFRPIAYNELYM